MSQAAFYGEQMNRASVSQPASWEDRDSFNRLVLAYQDQVYSQAYYLVGDAFLAEDLTQHTFLQAFEKIHTFRGGSMRVWLSRIVTNACYDELRRRKRHPVLPITQVDEDGDEEEYPFWLGKSFPLLPIEEAVERGELRHLLKRFLDDLPAAFREAVILVDVLDMDYQEAAQVLDIPIGTLKSRLARARLRLKNRLGEVPELLPDLAWQSKLAQAA